jgi:O-antigen/teichoic acid export membrane protein
LKDWVSLWKESLPLAVSYIFSALFFRIDVIMMSMLGKQALEIGYFAVGTRVIEGIGTLPALLSMALFPIMSDHGKSRPALFIKLFHRWRLYFLQLGLLTAGALILLRHPLIQLTFGPSYTRTSFLLLLLAASVPALFLNYWSINNLIVLGEQRYVAIATISALATNALCNLLWIPRWGAAGASVSVVIGQSALCGIATFYLRRRAPKIP